MWLSLAKGVGASVMDVTLKEAGRFLIGHAHTLSYLSMEILEGLIADARNPIRRKLNPWART